MDDPHVTISISPGGKNQSLARLKDLRPQETSQQNQKIPQQNQETPQQKVIKQLVLDFMKYLFNDLKARHPANVPGQETKPPLLLPRALHVDELRRQLPKRGSEPICDFVEKLEALITSSAMMSYAHSIGFLLGAICHCGPRLPILQGDRPLLGQSTTRTRRARYGRASLVCAVVDRLLPSWGGRAYVLFHPLAGEPHFLGSDISNDSQGSQAWYRSLRDLSQEDRMTFLDQLVSKLEQEVAFVKEIEISSCTFDPEIEMAKLLNLEPDTVNGLLLPSRAMLQQKGEYYFAVDGSDSPSCSCDDGSVSPSCSCEFCFGISFYSDY